MVAMVAKDGVNDHGFGGVLGAWWRRRELWLWSWLMEVLMLILMEWMENERGAFLLGWGGRRKRMLHRRSKSFHRCFIWKMN